MEAEGDIPATCPKSWDGAVGMGHLGHSWPAKGKGPQTGLWMALLNGDQVLDKDTPEGTRKIGELGPVDLYFWSYLCLCVDSDEPFENIHASLYLFLGQKVDVAKPVHSIPPPALRFFGASDVLLYLCLPSVSPD